MGADGVCGIQKAALRCPSLVAKCGSSSPLWQLFLSSASSCLRRFSCALLSPISLVRALTSLQKWKLIPPRSLLGIQTCLLLLWKIVWKVFACYCRRVLTSMRETSTQFSLRNSTVGACNLVTLYRQNLTPLHAAILPSKNQHKMVHLLLQHGADVHAKNECVFCMSASQEEYVDASQGEHDRTACRSQHEPP